MTKTLLLGCCALKKKTPGLIPAQERYQGIRFKLAPAQGKKFGWSIWILSAQLGWIRPETLIPDYNTRFEKPYEGKFPKGEGCFFGGQAYFKNVPPSFKPLVPTARMGWLTNYLYLLADSGQEWMQKSPCED